MIFSYYHINKTIVTIDNVDFLYLKGKSKPVAIHSNGSVISTMNLEGIDFYSKDVNIVSEEILYENLYNILNNSVQNFIAKKKQQHNFINCKVIKCLGLL